MITFDVRMVLGARVLRPPVAGGALFHAAGAAAQIGFDGQPGLPVLAPYVSIRVALVDLADLRLKREQSLAVASRLPVTRESAANPWAATTVEQRVKALEALIEAELPKAVKSLVAP